MKGETVDIRGREGERGPDVCQTLQPGTTTIPNPRAGRLPTSLALRLKCGHSVRAAPRTPMAVEAREAGQM